MEQNSVVFKNMIIANFDRTNLLLSLLLCYLVIHYFQELIIPFYVNSDAFQAELSFTQTHYVFYVHVLRLTCSSVSVYLSSMSVVTV